MVWTITIATFLGTVIALLLMFLLFSRREQIRVGTQRAADRKTDSGDGWHGTLQPR